MNAKLKILVNFTLQVQFLTFVLGILATVLAALDVSKDSVHHLAIVSFCLLVTTILFLGTFFDIFKESSFLHKFNLGFHVVGGLILIIGSIVAMALVGNRDPSYYSRDDNALLMCSGGISILNSLLYFLIGWQLIRGLSAPDEFQPLHCLCSCTIGKSHDTSVSNDWETRKESPVILAGRNNRSATKQESVLVFAPTYFKPVTAFTQYRTEVEETPPTHEMVEENVPSEDEETLPPPPTTVENVESEDEETLPPPTMVENVESEEESQYGYSDP